MATYNLGYLLMTSGDPLKTQIDLSLQKAEAHRNRLKNADRRYSILNIVLGAIATFIAGEAAISGTPMVGGWRVTTTIASVCTLGATLSAGIHKQVASPELLIETSECAAKLKSLKIETLASSYPVEEVRDTYQNILSEFSRVET
ncbi:MAG: hypothetical protein AAFU53_03965 [Cyanobacteria bacterium J06632_3]